MGKGTGCKSKRKQPTFKTTEIENTLWSFRSRQGFPKKCVWQGTVPIAVEGEYPSGFGVNVQSFECPIVEGDGGEDLPALLGLKSMSEKNAILEMTPGKESLIFPGPGGYEIKLAPGYTKIPLQRAPSGHLCIPTGNFNAQPSTSSSSSSSSSAGLPRQHLTLHAQLEE